MLKLCYKLGHFTDIMLNTLTCNIELADLVYCLFCRKLGLKIDTFLTVMGTGPIWVNLTRGCTALYTVQSRF